MNTGKHHSESTKDSVRDLWTAGRSQREIARSVGISKNSIPGLIRRMGLPKRAQDLVRKTRGWTAHRIELAKPKAPPVIGPIGDFPDGATCRHIAGAPDAKFQCCGQPGFPYCEYHAVKTHAPRPVEP